MKEAAHSPGQANERPKSKGGNASDAGRWAKSIRDVAKSPPICGAGNSWPVRARQLLFLR